MERSTQRRRGDKARRRISCHGLAQHEPLARLEVRRGDRVIVRVGEYHHPSHLDELSRPKP